MGLIYYLGTHDCPNPVGNELPYLKGGLTRGRIGSYAGSQMVSIFGLVSLYGVLTSREPHRHM